MYTFGKCVMWIGLHLLYRIKYTGREHIPAEGGFILCANHIHSLDPVVLAIGIKRRLQFMAKKELFQKKWIAWLLDKLGAFPVDRQAADMRSYKQAMEVLHRGGGLMVFSQGHRMKEFTNAKSGVALFSLKTGTPIIPVGISGNYKWFSPIRVRFGAPISPEAYQGRRINTETVNELMASVVPVIKELSQ